MLQLYHRSSSLNVISSSLQPMYHRNPATTHNALDALCYTLLAGVVSVHKILITLTKYIEHVLMLQDVWPGDADSNSIQLHQVQKRITCSMRTHRIRPETPRSGVEH